MNTDIIFFVFLNIVINPSFYIALSFLNIGPYGTDPDTG